MVSARTALPQKRELNRSGYRIDIDKHYYSAPFERCSQEREARFMQCPVGVFLKEARAQKPIE